jgi:hypothetical protein
MLRTPLNVVPRSHDTAGFHGSWLPGKVPGACGIGVCVGPCQTQIGRAVLGVP